MSVKATNVTAEGLVKQCLLHLNQNLPSDTSYDVMEAKFDVRQLYAFIEDAGQEMAARGPWRSLLRIKGGIESQHDDETNRFLAPYPDDYHAIQEEGSMIDENFFNPVQVWKEAGAWEAVRASPQGRGDDPDLMAFLDADGIVFNKDAVVRMRYYTTNWVASDGGGASDQITSGNDRFYLPIVCLRYGALYRWRRSQGQDYADFQSQYEALVDSEFRSSRNLEPEDGGTSS